MADPDERALRDEMHQRSLVSKAATAVIAGLGARGYVVAIQAIDALIAESGSAS